MLAKREDNLKSSQQLVKESSKPQDEKKLK